MENNKLDVLNMLPESDFLNKKSEYNFLHGKKINKTIQHARKFIEQCFNLAGARNE